MRLDSRHLPHIALLVGLLALPAFAADPSNILVVGACNCASGQTIAPNSFWDQSWTFTSGFTQVSISAFVYTTSADHTAATAYLTTQTGAGATVATLIAQANVTLPVGGPGSTPELQLFSGLTLPAGTYHLVLTTADTSNDEGWENGFLASGPVFTADGVTFHGPTFQAAQPVNTAYPPASDFNAPFAPGLAFNVTGVAQASAGTYYTNPAPSCPKSHGVAAVEDTPGHTVGYSCYVDGVFVWFAAGGPSNNTWKSLIRTAAPETGSIKAEYLFYDTNGNGSGLDTVLGDGTHVNSTSDVDSILAPNQPLELDLLGAASEAPSYHTTQTGSIFARFFCPDDLTCSNASAQLIYSALPSLPWSLSVPLSLWSASGTTFYAEGTDDGSAHRVSFVVYNAGNADSAVHIYVYDASGNVAATGITPTIAGANSVTHRGGTYGNLLSQVIQGTLPPGLFKVVFDSGTQPVSVEVLQFDGPSATNLQVSPDTSPNLLP